MSQGIKETNSGEIVLKCCDAQKALHIFICYLNCFSDSYASVSFTYLMRHLASFVQGWSVLHNNLLLLWKKLFVDASLLFVSCLCFSWKYIDKTSQRKISMQKTVLLEEKVRVTMFTMILFYVFFNYIILICLRQKFCFSDIFNFYVVSGLEL